MKRFECGVCGSAGASETCADRFGKYIMPQTTKYFFDGMASIGVVPKPKFVTAEKYVRAENPEINEFDMDFDEGDDGEGEGDEEAEGLDIE